MESKTITKINLNGNAPLQEQFSNVEIDGSIDSVFNYLKDCACTYNPAHSVIRVNAEMGFIGFYGNLNSSFNIKIEGRVKSNPLLKTLGINYDKMWTAKELDKVIRFNKSIFAYEEQYTQLLTSIRGYRIRRSGEVSQTKTHNKSETLLLSEHDWSPIMCFVSLKLFTGNFDPANFTITVYASVDDAGAKFWLECDDMDDLMRSTMEKEIANQLELLAPFKYPIIYS